MWYLMWTLGAHRILVRLWRLSQDWGSCDLFSYIQRQYVWLWAGHLHPPCPCSARLGKTRQPSQGCLLGGEVSPHPCVYKLALASTSYLSAGVLKETSHKKTPLNLHRKPQWDIKEKSCCQTVQCKVTSVAFEGVRLLTLQVLPWVWLTSFPTPHTGCASVPARLFSD